MSAGPPAVQFGSTGAGQGGALGPNREGQDFPYLALRAHPDDPRWVAAPQSSHGPDGMCPEGDNVLRVESMFEICHRMKVARCSYPSK
jgi:hypothetical protein